MQQTEEEQQVYALPQLLFIFHFGQYFVLFQWHDCVELSGDERVLKGTGDIVPPGLVHFAQVLNKINSDPTD
jgi:hypothetical protein